MCILAHPLFDSASLALYESGECDRNQEGWISYIHIGVGSKRCSFNYIGQTRASTRGTSNKRLTHFLCLYQM